MADFAPITAEERANNKANRLKHAASPADGLTVRVLDKRHANTSFASRGVEPGAVVVLSRDTALQAIKDEHAGIAE